VVLLPKKSEAQTVTVDAEAGRLDMLEAFAELVSERFGYAVARKLKMAEMNEKIEAEKKQAQEIRKAIAFRLKFDKKNGGYTYDMGEVLKEAVETGNWQAFEGKLTELSGVKKAIDGVATPYRKEANILAKAVKYIDTVAIPASLNELGYPIEARFSLSDWVKKGIESQRKRKK
jgi:hypothetical protein